MPRAANEQETTAPSGRMNVGPAPRARWGRGSESLLAVALVASCVTAPPPPNDGPVSPPPDGIHEVGRGETVYSIARLYDVDVRDIIALNHLSRPDRIYVGQNLLIPDYHSPVGGAHPPPPPRPPKRPCAKAKAAPRTGSSQGLLWPPTDGLVLDRPRDKRRAKVSFTARQGAPVWAAADGQVVYAGEQSGYGLMVVIRHKQLDIMTVYAQAGAICVGIGSQVRRGDVIALVGHRGRRGRARLYFELLNGNEPVPSGR